MLSKMIPLTLAIVVLAIGFSPCVAFGQVRVSPNGRYLTDLQDRPFFWLGDTGWGLFQIPDRDEVEFYLKTRSEQGFTVVHAAACHDNPFITPALQNRWGDPAFVDGDLTKPAITPGNDPNNPEEYDYWDHVEYVIDAANRHGITIVFLPIFTMEKEGGGYQRIDLKNGPVYARFLGQRFGKKQNLIWCLGGDVLADTEQEKQLWHEMGKAITVSAAGSEDYSKTVMTFHTRGGQCSRDFFPDAAWLDIHMLQTWDSYKRICDVVSRQYQVSPAVPILHGEGAYEDGPEYPTKPITAQVIRQQAYWAFTSGGLHTYGNTNIWNFGSNPKYDTQDWKQAIQSPGAKQLQLYRQFWESIRWWELQPAPQLIEAAEDFLATAMLSEKHDRAVVYFPENHSLNWLPPTGPQPQQAYWWDPRTGKQKTIAPATIAKNGQLSPPQDWEDALLVIQFAP